MQLLKDRIQKDGVVLQGNILKVDSFLNHQMDPALMAAIGQEFANRFKGSPITKILTIEASGIAPALFAGYFLNIPVVFAKKSASSNIDASTFAAPVHSYTRGTDNFIRVSSRYLNADDHILIIDDFLAHGEALLGLSDIVRQAGASLAGAGIVIEKGFQDGGRRVRDKGIRVESLAIIKSMVEGHVEFEQT